jgi:hypothetical protein
MQKWEYLRVTFHLEINGLEVKRIWYVNDQLVNDMSPDWLNSCGSQGWELVGLTTIVMPTREYGDYYYIFKRPKA